MGITRWLNEERKFPRRRVSCVSERETLTRVVNQKSIRARERPTV